MTSSNKLPNETDYEYFARVNAETIFQMKIENEGLYEDEDCYEEFFCNDCKCFCDGREMMIKEDDEIIGFHVIEDEDDDYILPLGFNMEDVFCLSQALYFIHEFLPKKYRLQTIWKYDIDDYILRFQGDCRD